MPHVYDVPVNELTAIVRTLTRVVELLGAVDNESPDVDPRTAVRAAFGMVDSVGQRLKHLPHGAIRWVDDRP